MKMSSMSHTSFSSSRGDSIDFDSDLTLNDRLKAFKSSHFDPEAYVSSKCQSMHEKELRHLCAYLADLKKASAEEMRISVYANYAAFIRTSREISDLEGQLLSMRNLLSSQGAVVQGLADGVQVNLLDVSSDDLKDDYGGSEKAEPSKTMESRLVEFSDTMEVLLAEKRVEDALAKLEEGKKMKDQRTLTPSALLSLELVISEHRQRLADQLAETICERSTRGSDLRSAILALKQLGDGPRAHTMLLKSHHKKLQSAMQGLRSMTTLSGGAYTATVCQLVFTTIAQAANDSTAAFREEPSFMSELVTWAVKETEEMSLLLKRHVIASSAGAGGFRVATECVRICLGHCFVLEGRGLALLSVLVRQFRPCIEQALSTNLKRIEQISAALAAADDWSLLHTPLGGRPLRVPSTSYLSGATASQPKLSSSAHKFNTMVQEFIEDMGHLLCLQLDGLTMEGVLQVFTAYVALLTSALPSSADSEENTGGPGPKIVKIAETEVQQLALLANALLLGDELLPRAAMRLLPPSNVVGDDNLRRSADKQARLSEQREWKKRLMRSVDRLRDSFCRQHALELIFSEDGEIRLSPFMYLNLDDQMEEPEWFPSPVFQELFTKVSRLACITTDVLVGRERFSTVLLMRLTETVILWLSDDQSFWEEIETGPKALGPHGLRQLYLDMEFVILFASQGRYLSRHLHQVIKTMIERAIEIVASTGIDPYSVLPDDEWFADVAQISIKMLTGKANFGNQERDVNSPTASASARSVSSVVSHGSH